MKIPEIKICGLTTMRDVRLVLKYKAEYAGVVMFCEKSRRNNTMENAWKLAASLGSQIQKVAVCESPTREQVQMIEHMGYDILQVHGELGRDVLNATSLPVFRAYNVGNSDEVQPERSDKIIAYVLDGAVAGSGEKFEWNDMKSFDRDGKKLVLAGGLTADNVREGIRVMAPDIVDVSSYVERKSGEGKDEDKIRKFVERVRENG